MRMPPQPFAVITNRLLLVVFDYKETPGGLVMPDNVDARSMDHLEAARALVVAAGPDCKSTKRGHLLVCRNSNPAWKIVFRQTTYVMIEESAVVGILTDPKTGEPYGPFETGAEVDLDQVEGPIEPSKLLAKGTTQQGKKLVINPHSPKV